MVCIFLKDGDCMLIESLKVMGKTVDRTRDDSHKIKFCEKGKTEECPFYLIAKADPIICPHRCYHHEYYPHYLCPLRLIRKEKIEPIKKK